MVLVNGELCHHPLRQLQVGDVISFRDRQLKRRLAYFFMHRLLRFQKFGGVSNSSFFNTRFGKYKGKFKSHNGGFSKNKAFFRKKGNTNSFGKANFRGENKLKNHDQFKFKKPFVRKGNSVNKTYQVTQKARGFDSKGNFKKPVKKYSLHRSFASSTKKITDKKLNERFVKNIKQNNKNVNGFDKKFPIAVNFVGRKKKVKNPQQTNSQVGGNYVKKSLVDQGNKKKKKSVSKIKLSTKLFSKKFSEVVKRLNQRRRRNLSPVLLTHLGGLRQYNLVFLPRLLAVQVVDYAYLLKNVYYPNSLDFEVLKVHFKSLS